MAARILIPVLASCYRGYALSTNEHRTNVQLRTVLQGDKNVPL